MNSKHQAILNNIKSLLASQSPEDTIRQLYECRTDGPSVEEFLGMKETENKSESISILGIS